MADQNLLLLAEDDAHEPVLTSIDAAGDFGANKENQNSALLQDNSLYSVSYEAADSFLDSAGIYIISSEACCCSLNETTKNLLCSSGATKKRLDVLNAQKGLITQLTLKNTIKLLY